MRITYAPAWDLYVLEDAVNGRVILDDSELLELVGNIDDVRATRILHKNGHGKAAKPELVKNEN